MPSRGYFTDISSVTSLRDGELSNFGVTLTAFGYDTRQQLIELLQFRKSYSGRLILQADNLFIQEGISLLRGINGSGKTTLLRSIAGIIPFGGRIRLLGIDQNEEPVKYRSLVGYSEAKPAYPVFLTGMDLFEFYRQARKTEYEKAVEILDRFGVREYYRDKIETYSEGMHKKLSLSLALIGMTPLILLDEPFAFLDASARSTLHHTIDEFRNKHKISFLLSGHSPDPDHMWADVREYRIENSTLIRYD